VSRALRVPRVVRAGTRRATAAIVRPIVVPAGRTVRGRLAHVSVTASMRAGAWAGFVLGLLVGAPIGAFVAWLAGAVLGWQRDLGFTLGIARNLLPFGDQIGVLRTVSANWPLVVPGVALATAALGAILLALVGGILAAAYNATGGHASIVVELEPDRPTGPTPDGEPAAGAAPTVVEPAPGDDEA
jgi:hypothetical protein